MAVRRWAVRAPDGEEVDRNAVVAAIMDGESILWRAGGVLTILPYRQPTDIPSEMVTTAVLIEWKDRTDAKPQPEVAQAPAAAPAPGRQLPADATLNDVTEAAIANIAEPIGSDGVPDGLDPATLEEEDLSSVTGAV